MVPTRFAGGKVEDSDSVQHLLCHGGQTSQQTTEAGQAQGLCEPNQERVQALNTTKHLACSGSYAAMLPAGLRLAAHHQQGL